MKRTTMTILSAMLLLPGVAAAQAAGPSAGAKTGSSASSATAAGAQGAPQQPAEGQPGAQAATARIDAALSAAAQAHVPVSLLESKVEEGRAKRVPEERIASAVEARLHALVRASEVMRKAGEDQPQPGELAVTADAIQAGVAQSALVQITREAPGDRRAVAVATLSDLVQLGLASEQALLRVDGALSRGGEALANLRAEAAASLRVKGGVGVKLP
ncbi:MAG TPA: hypothetical protein VFQ38_05385 [Longimicrobiales bacterium]|nr:hypothetical protein [Longimicrobiales bacterium]